MTLRTLSIGALLLASTALVAPAVAFAQDPAQAEPQDTQTDETSEIDEIVVLGRYIPTPNRESAEVAAFLTAEDIQRTGDSNAAAALTRVTGLSIVEGRFVYVRGLGERYSSALLNGSPLPSPEPLQRVVPLDLFPSNILGGVTVQKSYSPNYPGEFGGGVIDLQTIDAPSEPFFHMQVGVGGNSESTGKNGLTYYGSDRDWTGFDDGVRDLPGELRTAFATGLAISPGNFTDVQLQNIGRSLVNSNLRVLQRDEAPIDWSVQLSGGLSAEDSLGTLGFVFVAGYDNQWRQRRGIQEEGQFSGAVLVPSTTYEVESGQNDIQWNLLTSLSLSRTDHEVKWTNFFIRTTTKEARTEEGPDFDAGGSVIRNDYTEWFVRELFTTQLAGEHTFLDGSLDVDWRVAYARTSRDAPYETRFQYGVDGSGNYLHNIAGNRISFSELADDIVSGGVDVSYRLPLSEAREAVFSAGIASFDNDRSAERRDLQFTTNSSLTLEQRRARVDYLFSDYNIGPNLLELRTIAGGNGASAYDANLQVDAAYVMVDAEFIPLLRTTFGVRYEDGTQSVTLRDLYGATPPASPPALEEQYWLPSATATWNFYEDMQFRIGASQTIGRPQFRELAPQAYTDPESNRTFIGNPFLTDTELTNIDARYEWFFARQQYVTAGAFYKILENPVESVISAASTGDRQQSFINAPEAVIYGLELEAKKFWEFPEFGNSFIANKRWLVQANYTWSQSEVRVDAGDRVIDPSGSSALATFYMNDGDPLQGQSEHVVNLQLGWEDDTDRSQATLIVNYVSERITARGAGPAGAREPDYVQEPGVFLDFVYRQDFDYAGREFGLALEARNLLGTDFDEHQDLGNRIRINQYDLGTSFSASLTTRF